MHFCFWIIAVVSEGKQTSFMFARYFCSLCNSVSIVFHTFVFNLKTSLEKLKKVHRNCGVLLTVHLSIILAINQLNAQNLLL